MDTVMADPRETLHSLLLIPSKEEVREGMVLQTQTTDTRLNQEVSTILRSLSDDSSVVLLGSRKMIQDACCLEFVAIRFQFLDFIAGIRFFDEQFEYTEHQLK